MGDKKTIDVIILGAGGHAQVIAGIITAMNSNDKKYKIIGFLDNDKSLHGKLIRGIPVLGSIDSLQEIIHDSVIVGIGDNRTRSVLFNKLYDQGELFVNAIHPSAVLMGEINLGVGIVISGGVVINAGARIHNNVILNTGCTVDHHNIIHDHVHIAPGCNLGGEVKIHEGSFIGMNTSVLPLIEVGAWSEVGAGAVVNKNLEDGVLAFGVPARIINKKPKTELNQIPHNSKIVFAGNRNIAVQVLEILIAKEIFPAALLMPDPKIASHNEELRERCHFIPDDLIFFGDDFKKPDGTRKLSEIAPDYIICVHFPYIIPQDVLSIPRIGVLNLHPSYLPFNRGWHTPSWAILTETPIGGTLHFMDEGIDTGDIVLQKEVEVFPGDTADTLYQRVLEIELEVFTEALPSLLDYSFKRRSQKNMNGTTYKKKDLLSENMRKLNLDEEMNVGELLKRLRALTTNILEESAYYEVDGSRYFVQLKITKEKKYEE